MCGVTVTDTSPGSASTPTGTAGVSADSQDGSGSFSDGPCTLSQVSVGVASCAVFYTPSDIGVGSRGFIVQYSGDSIHQGGFLSIGFGNVSVVAGPSGSTTTISCAVCAIPVGGKQTTITVQAKSADGQPLRVGGNTVRLATTRGRLSAVTDNGNGTYTAALTSPRKGRKAIVSGTIDGQRIVSTVTVTFTAAAPSARTTTISAGRVNVPLTTGETQILVDSQDRFGNDIRTGGARVRLKVTAGTLLAVRDLKNGNYSAILKRNNARDQKVVVTGRINGKRIKDTAVVFFR